jgi:5-methylcytosine-specific restriction endonuclease McrA
MKYKFILNIDSSGIKLQGKDFLRELVRIRDKHTCQVCGLKWIGGKRKWEKNNRRLDVHHLISEKEGKEGEIYRNNKDFENMITLCHKCHMNLHVVKEKVRIGKEKSYPQLT